MKRFITILIVVVIVIVASGCTSTPTSDIESGWKHFDVSLVHDVEFDPDGHIWAAGYYGVADIEPQTEHVTLYTSENGLARTDSGSVAVSPSGEVWVAVKKAGVARFSNNVWTAYSPGETVHNANINSITAMSDGSIWFSSSASDGGIGVFNNGAWSVITTEDGLPERYVVDVAESSDGSIWIATYCTGVTRMKDGVVTHFGPDQGLDFCYNEVITVVADDSVWLGTTTHGVYHFTNNEWHKVDAPEGWFDGPVSAVCGHPDGSIWFGTIDGAVVYRDGVWHRLTREDGLPVNDISDIAISNDGSLCFATRQNVSLLSAP